MTRLDPYSSSLREEQKAILNTLLGTIYDTNDRARQMQASVDSIYRITVTLLVIILLLIGAGVMVVLYYCCKKYQNERSSPMHQSRKSAPIEI